jgi:serine/threonine protein kinase
METNSIYKDIFNEGKFYKYPNYDKEVSISNLCPLKIGNHNIIVGKGTFSEVYLSKHNETDKVYAIKHMNVNLIMKTMHTLQVIHNEIEIHGKLQHKNIIRLYNYYENKTDIYLIMEHASKGSLFSLLKQNGPFDEAKAREYFIQVVSAVHYLHRNNIIHRDIKPENILVNENDECKLCDFGWANYVEMDNVRSTFCGTLEYMSPEILGQEYYKKEIDIWALGVLLYELIHGCSPFISNDNNNNNNYNDYHEMLKNIQAKGIIFNKDISQSCKDLIMKMLEVDGQKRIDIDDIAKHEFILGSNNNNEQKNKKIEINVEDDVNDDDVQSMNSQNEEQQQQILETFMRSKKTRAFSHKYVIPKGMAPIKMEQSALPPMPKVNKTKFSRLLFGDDIDVLSEDIGVIDLKGSILNKSIASLNNNEKTPGKKVTKIPKSASSTKSEKNKIVIKFQIYPTERKKHISSSLLPTLGQQQQNVKKPSLFSLSHKIEDEQRNTGTSSNNSLNNKEEFVYNK